MPKNFTNYQENRTFKTIWSQIYHTLYFEIVIKNTFKRRKYQNVRLTGPLLIVEVPKYRNFTNLNISVSAVAFTQRQTGGKSTRKVFREHDLAVPCYLH